MSSLQSNSFPPSLLCFSLVTFPQEVGSRESYRGQIHQRASGSGLGLGLGSRPRQEDYDLDEITPLQLQTKAVTWAFGRGNSPGLLLVFHLWRFCRRIFALWMCALRVMGLCQRRCWHSKLWTDASKMPWCFSRAKRFGILRFPSILIPGSTLVMQTFLVSFSSNWRNLMLCIDSLGGILELPERLKSIIIFINLLMLLYNKITL